MKRKNDDQSFADFATLWVTMHIVYAFILVIASLLFISARPCFSLEFREATALFSSMYLYLIPYLAICISLTALSMMQLWVMSRSLCLFSRRWHVYSSFGVVGALLMCFASFWPYMQMDYGQMNRPHAFLYSSAAFILVVMGAFQAAALVRQHSLRDAMGWLLAHIVVAGAFLYTQNFVHAIFSVPLLGCITSMLCWLLYRHSLAKAFGVEM